MEKFNPILLLILCHLGIITASNAQDKSRLSFSEFSAYYSNGTMSGGSKKTAIGNTVGLVANYNAPYKDYDENELVLGYSANFCGGWNLTKGKAARYGADIGIWSSKLLTKNVEVGAQYSFLGVYSYQNISFFGSSFQAAVKIFGAQLTYSREGEGAIFGFIKPKTSGAGANALGLKYFLYKNLAVGCRYTSYPLNKEYAVSVSYIPF
ncbi:hypothetical protein [Pelobium manganitolerans]|nr:hypothetical protein [Pelobium manganitolerans]